MSSLKTNVVLNFVNTLTGIVFPVVTFPYAARVLLPEGIGVFNFLQSIIAYIVLLTSLGIPMYAVREVAKFRDDIKKRNKVTIEITILSLFLCLFGYIAVWVLGEMVPQIHSHLSVFYVLSLTILFTSIGVEWFYRAIEDFRFITIRAVAFRILAAIALFLFVRTENDLLVYAFVIVGSTVGNNIINFIHLKKFIFLERIDWHSLQIWKHLIPSCRIFVFNLVVSIYVNLNVVMLGFISGDSAVGYYTAGNKMAHVVLSVVASLGVVMLPRCSNLIEQGLKSDFLAITRKSYRFVLATSIPSTVGLILLSTPIIMVFAGKEFLAASAVLCWTAPVIVFIGLSNVFGIQILYPQGQEKLVIWSTIGGAIFNFLLNLFLIPLYSYVGAAVATFVAELVVLVIQMWGGRRYIPFSFFERCYLHYVIAALVMAGFVFPITIWISNVGWLLPISVLVGGIVYGGVLFMMKDALFMETIAFIFRRIKKS